MGSEQRRDSDPKPCELTAVGLDIRTPVRVCVMRGCLVLTVEDALKQEAPFGREAGGN